MQPQLNVSGTSDFGITPEVFFRSMLWSVIAFAALIVYSLYPMARRKPGEGR